MHPFTVRAAGPADAAGIAALSESVYGLPRAEAHVRWKLFETPADPGVPSSFVAESAGVLVGHYAGTPTRFWVDGAMRTGLHGCDVMTAAPMRRHGVLTALGTAAHEAWRAAGLVFVTGLANEAWGTRSAALGWRNLFELRWLVALLRPETILTRRLGMASAPPGAAAAGALYRRLATRRPLRDAGLSLEEAEAAGPELDTLWESCRGEHETSVVRDRRWVDWRYGRAPGTRYRLMLARRGTATAGYAAFSARAGSSGHAAVAELFTARDDAAARDALLRACLDALRAEGAESVRTLAAPGSPSWSSFRRAGFLPRSAYTFEVVPLDPVRPLETLSRPEQWMLAAGDFDVV